MMIIGSFKLKYSGLSGVLKLKNVELLNEKTYKPITPLDISALAMKDFESLADIIYDNSKRY